MTFEELSEKELERYAGEYKLQNGINVTITSDGKQLWAEAAVLPKEALITMSDHRFFVISVNSTVTFQLADGKVTGMQVETPDGTFSGERKK